MFNRKKLIESLKKVILIEVTRKDAEKLGFDPSGMGLYAKHKPESVDLEFKSQNDEEVKSMDYHDITVIKMIRQAVSNLVQHGADSTTVRALYTLEDYMDNNEYDKAAIIVKKLMAAHQNKGPVVKELFHIYSYLADNADPNF